jgi:carbonic anhydrase
MDGRVQFPVLTWIKEKFNVDFIDVITEAGMDGVLSEQNDISEILRSITISVNANKSDKFFVVGHYDCRGNSVAKDVHCLHILNAVKRLKNYWPDHEVVGLWVNENWQVEIVK